MPPGRHSMMLRPVLTLVAARLRRRAASTALTVAAVGAAAGLVAIVAGIGLIASDATLARALATGGADRPVVRASAFRFSGVDAAAAATNATDAMRKLDAFSEPVVRGVLVHELRDLRAPVFELIVAVDDPVAWITLTDGRLPAPCIDGSHCEAVLLAEAAPVPALPVANPADGLELTIVGRGQLDRAIPFGALDQRGPFGSEPGGGQYQTGRASPAVLLVSGVDAIARSAALDRTGRTYVWTAPLDVSTVHPWSADALRDAVADTARTLAAIDDGYSVESPIPLVDAEIGRAAGARGRLLLIGSLGVAILLAFAVFLALVVRDDVAAEVDRLKTVGARRRERVAFLVLEALIPALAGGIVGWAAGALVVGLLATWKGVDALAVVGGTVLALPTILGGLVVLALSVATIVVATAPGIARAGSVRTGAAMALTAVAVLGWQLASGGSLDASGLAASLASPIVVLLPPVLAFLLALALVGVLPPLLRTIARRTSAAPLTVRLSLLSISRDPGRPAATLTLLAFSLGAMVFAAGWSASLRQGIDDGAAYRSGLDLRVTELGTGLSIGKSVVPVGRYAALGPGVTSVPVYRDASASGPGGQVDIVGIDPAALPTLPGWRADFSTTPITELAGRLAVASPAGGWQLAGHRLSPTATDLVVRFRYVGRPLTLDAVVATPDGDSTRIALGIVDASMTEVRAPLPDGTAGGLLTALIFRDPGLVAGSGHQDELRRATVTFEGLDGLVDARPIDLEIFTVASVVIRAPSPIDDVVLPAVVTPDLAGAPDGRLDLHFGGDAVIPLHVIGTATRMPSVVDAQPRFAVVPLDPFLVALAEAVPGSGRPNEMWLSVPDPARRAAVGAALAADPFRFAEVTTRAGLAAERAGDPLSQSIVWALVVAALAGLSLSVGGLAMGTVTDLRDERGELADLEAQGVTPSALRWHALARTAWLALGGAVAGLVVGLVLTFVVTAALSLTAEGTAPIPPLVVVVPVLPIVAIVAGVVATVLAIAALLARRAYRHGSMGAPRFDTAAATWRADPERVDG